MFEHNKYNKIDPSPFKSESFWDEKVQHDPIQSLPPYATQWLFFLQMFIAWCVKAKRSFFLYERQHLCSKLWVDIDAQTKTIWGKAISPRTMRMAVA